MTQDSAGARPVGGAFDPARHLLAETWNRRLWYSPEPADGSDPPVPLDAHVTAWLAAIEAGGGLEAQLSARASAVVISHQRAEVISCLLRELAKRLRPGRTVGPVISDGTISALARDVADALRDQAY